MVWKERVRIYVICKKIFNLCKQRNQQHIANIYLLGFQGTSCPFSFITFKRCSMCEHFLFVQYKTVTKSSRILSYFFVDFQNFTKSKFVGDKYLKFWAFINLPWGKGTEYLNFFETTDWQKTMQYTLIKLLSSFQFCNLSLYNN